MLNPIKVLFIATAIQIVFSDNYCSVSYNYEENVAEETSDACVTYDFEESFDDLFSEPRFCGTFSGIGEWIWGNYSVDSDKRPNTASNSFISPGDGMSCTSSFTFPMSNTGTLEVEVYMVSESMTDQLQVLVNMIGEAGDTQAGTFLFGPMFQNYRAGWNTLLITWQAQTQFQGYVTFLGGVAENSILLVDGFRYLPPGYNEANCRIYPDQTTTTESVTGQYSPAETTTEENSTAETVTGASTTTETTSNEITTTEETETTDPGTSQMTTDPTSVTDPTSSSDENSTEENNTEENKTEENNTEENNIEENKTEENKTEENKTEENNTEEPENKPVREFSFWNPFTISMVVVLSFLALTLLSLCCYEYGKSKSQDQVSLIYNDIETPVTMIVPRVTKFYPDAKEIYL